MPQRPYDKIGAQVDRAAELALRELSRAERALQEAQVALDRVKGEYDFALKRYAALRDKFQGHYTGGPWPPTDESAYPADAEPCLDGFVRGQLRYLGMNLGAAIDWVLTEAQRPLTLEEIGDWLETGGLCFLGLREINAALLRLRGATKLPDGRYISDTAV